MKNLPAVGKEPLLDIFRKCNGGVTVDRDVYPNKWWPIQLS
jgi:hypothetical protein